VALTGDQRALLRLLALREEGYEDIAALLGVSVEEVRSRVRATLGELDGSEEAPRRGPSRQAAPEPPEAPAPRRRPTVEEQPPPREPEGAAPPEPRRPARRRAPSRRANLLSDRRRLVEIAGGALIALLLILFATGALDIGGEDSGSDDDGAGTELAGGERVTEAALTPPDGGDAAGRAVFGRIGKGPVLQVRAEGLEPTPQGQSYTVWLYRSPKLALRVGAVKVSRSGGVAAQFPIPVELLSYVAGGAFDQIYVSLTDDGAYRAEVRQARQERRLPAYSGTTVLRGQIEGPLAGGS
jgi:hypothetical protein